MAKRHGFVGSDFPMLDAEASAKEHSAAALFAPICLRRTAFTWLLESSFRAMGDETDFQKGLAALPEQAKLAQAIRRAGTAMWIIPAATRSHLSREFRSARSRASGPSQNPRRLWHPHRARVHRPQEVARRQAHLFVHDLSGMLELCWRSALASDSCSTRGTGTRRVGRSPSCKRSPTSSSFTLSTSMMLPPG